MPRSLFGTGVFASRFSELIVIVHALLKGAADVWLAADGHAFLERRDADAGVRVASVSGGSFLQCCQREVCLCSSTCITFAFGVGEVSCTSHRLIVPLVDLPRKALFLAFEFLCMEGGFRELRPTKISK